MSNSSRRVSNAQRAPISKDMEKALISNFTRVTEAFNQQLTTRTELFRRLMDPRRDISTECGHPTDIFIEDYSRVYERNGVGTRVVQVYADESWKTLPQVFEDTSPELTDFEKAFNELEEEHSIMANLRQIDILSGVAYYGVLLMGFNDGAPLRAPLNPGRSGGLELAYLRPLDNSAVSIAQWDTDESSPRFGKPTMYRLNLALGVDRVGVQTEPSIEEGIGVDVHWTRVIHVLDNRRNSPVFGEPRLKPVFNRVLDVEKVSAGSAEMFWKGGFPGIAIETQPGLVETIEFDGDAVKQQMDAYMNGLQRYIALLGMSARTLEVQISDPKNFYELQMRLITTALAVPWRVFMGSEAAQLASDQDATNWNTRLNARRKNHIDPMILRPFLNRMIELGVLPQPKEGYHIKWDDLNSPTDLDRARVADFITKALATYVQVGADVLFPPRDFLMSVLNMDATIVDRVMDEIDLDALRDMSATSVDRLMMEPGGTDDDPGMAPSDA